MKTDAIKMDHEYKIPQSGGVRAAPRASIPLRRLPPETAPAPLRNAEQKDVPLPAAAPRVNPEPKGITPPAATVSVPNTAQKGITPAAALGGG